MVEITYKCTNCDFSFKDKNLIFFIDQSNECDNDEKSENIDDLLNDNINNLEIFELGLNKENSDKMTKSLIAGFVYENYCPNCKELIKTYVPESNNLFTNEEIEKILTNEVSKSQSGNCETKFKILFFDFEKTFYKDRRAMLENNLCPNCNNEMSLVISEKIPCPECGNKLKEYF